ncbi:hypothetical protein [Nocardia fluminea]|uniref:hypothetical protein n=1 Tax=Nocardia fluminea TaxID=134984 RepID=UPI003654734B
MARFRRHNGVWIAGLASRAVFGTSALSSLAYGIGLSLAVWAALADRSWLAVPAGVLGGAAYAWSGHRWWAAYRRNPAAHAQAESWWTLLALIGLAVGGLVAVVILGR